MLIIKRDNIKFCWQYECYIISSKKLKHRHCIKNVGLKSKPNIKLSKYVRIANAIHRQIDKLDPELIKTRSQTIILRRLFIMLSSLFQHVH